MSLKLLLFTVSFLPLLLYAVMIARRRKFDSIIVMYHATHLAPFAAFLISRITRIPLVIKCHDVVSSEARWGMWDKTFRVFLAQLNAIALRQAYKILALSDELGVLIEKTYKVKRNKFAILPNGVNTQLFAWKPNSLEIRERYGLKDKIVIMHTGSLTPPYRRNGIRFLIEALPAVLSKKHDLVLFFVGDVEDRIQLELANLATALKIQNHIKFAGIVPYENVAEYISVADVCVGPLCPSLDTYGSVPRKVLEYMACAKPVIACFGGVSEDLITDNHNGLLVTYGDTKGLSSRLLELLENPKLAKDVGSKAREHALTFFDHEVLADKLVTILHGNTEN